MAGAAFGAAVTGLRPGHRDHVRRLHGAADGQPRQPGGEVLVRLERAGAASRWSFARRWAPAGASARCTRRSTAPGSRAFPGMKIVGPLEPGRREGPAQGGDPRRQPGDLPRAQAPLLGQGPGRRRRRRCRSARRRCVREGADVTIVSALQGRARRARGGRGAGGRRDRRRGGRPPLRCGRSTTRRCSRRSRRPTA